MRRLIVLALVVLAAAAVAAEPVPGRAYRIGWLRPSGRPSPQAYLLVALREMGYVEGKNLVIEHRFAEGRIERLPAMAAELVALKVDVIVATSGWAVQAARDATRTIPIVMGFATDPVGQGLVSSLARPGGNVTGVSYGAGEGLAGKRLELLKQTVPKATRIALLSTPEPSVRTQAGEAEKTARDLGVRLLIVEATDGHYDRAFATMVEQRGEAVFVLASSILSRDARRIAELAARHRLPALFEWRENVEAGGLMSYGPNQARMYRRVAAFVDRLLNGANPAELPVEQPEFYELVLNARTARALGLKIPAPILARADHVVD